MPVRRYVRRSCLPPARIPSQSPNLLPPARSPKRRKRDLRQNFQTQGSGRGAPFSFCRRHRNQKDARRWGVWRRLQADPKDGFQPHARRHERHLHVAVGTQSAYPEKSASPSHDRGGNSRILEPREAADVGLGKSGPTGSSWVPTRMQVRSSPEREASVRFGGRREAQASGAARVICFYHSEMLPLFLLSAYAKNQKSDLSQAGRNAMKRFVPVLVAGYLRKEKR